MLPKYPEKKRRELARNILQNTLRLKRGESFLIDTWTATLDWAESAALEARMIGARPMVVVEDEETLWKSVAEAPASHVGPVGGHEWAALKSTDAHLHFYGPIDTVREERIPQSVANRIMANNHEWFRLAQKAGIRSARWDLGRTNEYDAKRYGVDVHRWRTELIEAASVDPRTMQREGNRVAEILRRGHAATLSHSNGTELHLRLAGRKPKVDDGVIDEADIRAGNILTVVPSGVTTVAIDESYAEGRIVSNGSGVMFLDEAQTPLLDGNLVYKGGRLDEFHFKSGEAPFRRMYSKLGASAFRPGLLAVGLNSQISSIPLLFDQERGTLSFALGRNNFYGGATRTPHLTIYLALRGGSLEVDGQAVVEAGKLLV